MDYWGLIKNKRERLVTMNIIIINRWSDDFADYFRLINHSANNIIYITNPNGTKYLEGKSGYSRHLEVNDLTSIHKMEECLDICVDTFGKIDRIIAMSEYDMLVAGYLRTKYEVSGMSYQTALNFVDKTHMKNALSGSGIKYPNYTDDLNSIKNFSKNTSFPVVLKPKIGASSKGVLIAEDYDELMKLISSLDDKEKYECEEYVTGPIFHIDGVIFENEIKFIKGSRYINTCLDYEHGKSLGSMIVSDINLQIQFKSFAEKTIRTLGLETGVFHLEVILNNGELVFLEVGARQGGGEIVPMLKHLYGIDIIDIFFKTQMLIPFALNENKSNDIGGFLLIPEPKDIPCRVTFHNSMKELKSLVYEIIPSVGTLLIGNGGYYFNAGRFLFSGDEEQVYKDIHTAMESFQIITEKVIEEVRL